MVQINFARREVNCKIVYYGPGLSGKTTNLEVIHKRVPDHARGRLTSIATEQDRTLFFDFMPLDLGTVAGMKTKLFLYTVPGQVYYESTRKLVLQGADGVCFVADSAPDRERDNLDSMKNLEETLREYGMDPARTAMVIQYNKRDLPDAIPVASLDRALNRAAVPTFEAVAVRGEGVMQTLKGISRIVIEGLNESYASKRPEGATQAPKATTPPPPPQPVRPPTRRAPSPAPVLTQQKPAPRERPVPTPPRAPARTFPEAPRWKTVPNSTRRPRRSRMWLLLLLLAVLFGTAGWYFGFGPGRSILSAPAGKN